MDNIIYSIVGILIPFVGTSLGSSFVFFLKNKLSQFFHQLIIGFASGIMVAASIWSLILPSVEMAENQEIISWIPASVGLLCGIIILIFINKLSEKMKSKHNNQELNMLIFSVTLHNIPEGMAIGVCFAGFLSDNSGISLLAAMLLSIGIAIQNIPEGAIISMPLKMNGIGKTKSFVHGFLSGIVEPIAAIITLLLTNIVVPLLPYLLSFAAGAMIFVVFEELVPEMHNGKKSSIGIIGVTIGFLIMMILDISLG